MRAANFNIDTLIDTLMGTELSFEEAFELLYPGMDKGDCTHNESVYFNGKIFLCGSCKKWHDVSDLGDSRDDDENGGDNSDGGGGGPVNRAERRRVEKLKNKKQLIGGRRY